MPRIGELLNSAIAQCEPSRLRHTDATDRRRRRILIPALVAVALLFQLPLIGISQTLADVLFSYDNGGQLSNVTDQNYYQATYSYDSAGNVTSIGTTASSNETEVWLVTPSTGPAG
ncbi:MAG: RHS repeat domain-containing protein, partial [Candidatus Binataceae bacterium]